jgi:hypothetical protein
VLPAPEGDDLEARVDGKRDLRSLRDVLVDPPVQLAEGGQPRGAHPHDEVLVRHALACMGWVVRALVKGGWCGVV